MGPVGAITQPHVEPWSTVFRAETPAGALFLKACGPSQAHEPALTVLLAGGSGPLVPVPLAIHSRQPWMLLADGGAKLRDAFAGEALLEAWARILPRYAELQRRFLGHEDELLATGVPDRRLESLASQLQELLDGELMRTGTGRLAESDRTAVLHLLPALAARCRDLASLGIGATAQHDDLHDRNVLVGSGEVIFDWGDACLTHPFLTLCVTLRFAAERAGVAAGHPQIVRLRDAYLEAWSDLAPAHALREAAELARVLGAATRALCWYRVVSFTGGSLDDQDGWLRELAEQLPR